MYTLLLETRCLTKLVVFNNFQIVNGLKNIKVSFILNVSSRSRFEGKGYCRLGILPRVDGSTGVCKRQTKLLDRASGLRSIFKSKEKTIRTRDT